MKDTGPRVCRVPFQAPHSRILANGKGREPDFNDIGGLKQRGGNVLTTTRLCLWSICKKCS